ncbi:uncharacterized protein LOC119308115 isoform X1 [Triticum dicoccoides]|uniref:uncharacterized protein LOC119308115 isoform X1 n=2 Tax=Triticum dicoccoides TaxID=85692 RepID=UPI001890652A|nr:uncharacterized protein LOC119308115 isoform X1 [Triticum dicoccoides]
MRVCSREIFSRSVAEPPTLDTTRLSGHRSWQSRPRADRLLSVILSSAAAARSQPPSMATAEEGEGGEPPGLGRGRCPRFRRSEATRDMAGGGGAGGKEDGGTEPLLLSVLALPATALPAVVSRLEAAVPRKARSYLPRNVPSAWWSLRIPFIQPLPPAGDPANEEEGRRFPRPQRVQVAPSLDPGTADKPPKRLKRCLHCKAVETPQRRSGPMGRGTLCNACGVWYSKNGTLPEHLPVSSPIVDSPLENPIWEPEVPGAIYLVRKSATERMPPRTEAAPAPRPGTSCLHCGSSEPPLWIEGSMGRREVCTACGMRYKKGRLLPECRPAECSVTDSRQESPVINSPPESPIWEPEAPPSVHLPRKPSKKKKRRRSRSEAPSAPWPANKGKRCQHCGSSETPQWREGPKGRATLCNACGVRYRQGRLLPEYRPMASPTFVPTKHANSHRKVLQLHRTRQSNDEHPSPLPADSVTNLPPIRDELPTTSTAGLASEDPTDAPGYTDNPINVPSSLDSLLLDGPSAPLIVESEDFAIS